MDSTVFYFLFLYSFTLEQSVCPPIDYSAEARKVFQIEGITNPSSNEMRLAKRIVYETANERARAHKAEFEKGELQKQSDMLCRPLMAVKLKSSLETTINDLYPGGKPKRMSNIDAIKDIVTSSTVRFTERHDIMLFRRMVADSSIGIERFIEVIQLLYPKLSEASSHKMEDYASGVDLPEHTDVKKITEILKCAISPVHQDYIVAVQLILEPRGVPPKDSITIAREEYRCLRIMAESADEQEKLNAHGYKIKLEDIYRLFPTTQPTQVQFQMDTATKNIQFFKAHFGTAEVARKASYERNEWLKDVRVAVDLIPCNGAPVQSLVL